MCVSVRVCVCVCVCVCVYVGEGEMKGIEDKREDQTGSEEPKDQSEEDIRVSILDVLLCVCVCVSAHVCVILF